MRHHIWIWLLVLLAACSIPRAQAQEPPSNFVFVCKYITTPGEGERLQTGNNPIRVNINAIPVQPVVVGLEFADEQGRSLVIAFDVGQPDPPVTDCPPPGGGGTTTTAPPGSTTTTEAPTTTTEPGTTTTFPTPTPFAFTVVVGICPEGTPEISITFPIRADLDGQTGTLSFSTGGSQPLTFDSGGTVTIPYPASAGTGPVTLTYTLGAETATADVTFPADCPVATTTTLPAPSTTQFGAPTTTILGGPGATTLPGSPNQTTQTASSASSDPLSTTGSDYWPLALGAMILIVTGALVRRFGG